MKFSKMYTPAKMYVEKYVLPFNLDSSDYFWNNSHQNDTL